MKINMIDNVNTRFDEFNRYIINAQFNGFILENPVLDVKRNFLNLQVDYDINFKLNDKQQINYFYTPSFFEIVFVDSFNGLSEDEFNKLLKSSNFSVAITKEKVFKDSIKIFDKMFVYRLKGEIDFIKVSQYSYKNLNINFEFLPINKRFVKLESNSIFYAPTDTYVLLTEHSFGKIKLPDVPLLFITRKDYYHNIPSELLIEYYNDFYKLDMCINLFKV